jgi:hypothetical protein
VFLNTDAIKGIEDRLNSLNLEEENSSAGTNEQLARAAEVQTEPKNDVNRQSQESSSETNEEKEPHSVPYKRFQEVNASKKELRAKTTKLQMELQEARQELERTRSRQTEKPKDTFYEDLERQIAAEDDDPRYSSMEKRMAAYEEKVAAAELDSEIRQAKKLYPDVPEEVMLQAVINDSNVSLIEVAKEWSQFVAEIEERAFAKAGVSRQSTPVAPKRPQGATGGAAPTAPAKPRTMADAKASALAYFKQHGF